MDGISLDLLMIGTTILILALHAVDGHVARKRKETSDFGALIDIAGDRVVENVYWIYFAIVGLIPFWLPIIVVARGFVTDSLRSAAFAHGNTPFGEKTMIKSAWTRMLTSSRASRSIYGTFKTSTFLYLGGAIALVVMATIAVTMCMVPGLAVLVDGWEFVKG